jgi:hypothetical protein
MKQSGIVECVFRRPILEQYSHAALQDCTCLESCQNCSIELILNVACNENRTMDVTSDHLDVVARGGYGWREEVDDGEEIARRSENFGHPVGKSASFRISSAHTVLNCSQRLCQTTPLYRQSSFVKSERAKSSEYAVLQRR